MKKIIFNIFFITLFVSFCENKTMNQANNNQLQGSQVFYQMAKDLLDKTQYEWLIVGTDEQGRPVMKRIQVVLKHNSFFQLPGSLTRNNMR